MTGFGQRLTQAMATHGPLCVGIDPHPQLLLDWGLDDDVAGLRTFCLRVVEALGTHVAALKPQVAFFERFGSAGIAVLEDVIAACAQQDQLCIVDAKRGDIGSTMAGYAHAYLHPDSPLAADAVTLTPFLGAGSLTPALEMARAHERGVFLLALTSNPEGSTVQAARGPDGRSVAATIAAAAATCNRRRAAEHGPAAGLGDVGLVIGATTAAAAHELGIDLAGVDGPLLAPGLGAQGARAAEIAATFGPARGAVLANSSRAILAQGPDPATLRRGAVRASEELQHELG